MRILLVEDHETVAKNIKTFLELQQYIVTVAHDGNDGLEKAMTQEVDLLILDINLPGMDGYMLCSMLRESGKKMPILMLTARSKQTEMVKGLNLGADDYLAKPFDLDVLLARVKALLRRQTPEKSPVLTAGKLALDTNAQQLTKAGKKIALSPKEYALLEYLMRNKGIVQERPRLLEHVWGHADELMFSNTVDVHVAFLRRKIGKDAIQTVPNRGYLIPTE
ncbi:MAG TPA: response regulator transcription factor [Candidatus Peribacteria bacterium]|nr:response regulator transcription factor [Candidatus Peribacteria bacterium]